MSRVDQRVKKGSGLQCRGVYVGGESPNPC